MGCQWHSRAEPCLSPQARIKSYSGHTQFPTQYLSKARQRLALTAFTGALRRPLRFRPVHTLRKACSTCPTVGAKREYHPIGWYFLLAFILLLLHPLISTRRSVSLNCSVGLAWRASAAGGGRSEPDKAQRSKGRAATERGSPFGHRKLSVRCILTIAGKQGCSNLAWSWVQLRTLRVLAVLQ